MNLVDQAIRIWEHFRAGVVAELENIPEEHWDYRPAAGARTLREVALHIAEAGVGFTDELLRPDCSFSRLLDPRAQAARAAGLPRAQSKAEMVDLLRATGAEGSRRLRAIGEALAGQSMSMFGGEGSRLTGLWFAASHEGYHRGQLATYARSVGCVPALTRQIETLRQQRG